MTVRRIATGAVAALVVGAVVLLLSEVEFLRVASAALLLLGIALGVFAIATPQFVAADEQGEDT